MIFAPQGDSFLGACTLSVVYAGTKVEADVSLRNAGISQGDLVHVGVEAAPPSLMNMDWGGDAFRLHCNRCSGMGMVHVPVPVCSGCHRETVMLSSGVGSEVLAVAAGDHEAAPDTSQGLKFRVPADLADVRGVCAVPECGYTGVVSPVARTCSLPPPPHVASFMHR